MPKQDSIFKMKGTIDDASFYKTKDGYMVRKKGGVDAQKIATDPAFQRTRENGAEFGRAGKGGKLIRSAFRPLLVKAKDHRVSSRLTTELLKVVKSDPTNTRGNKNISDGDLTMIQGFNFNINASLNATLLVMYSTAIDRVTGELEVTIPAFVPMSMVHWPSGATHIKIVSGGAEIDFDTEFINAGIASSAFIPLDNVATALTTLTVTLTPNSTKRMLLALGIEFYQESNGDKYPLKNGAFNALALVKVDA